jgi:protein tyrosine phosphatase (PTP) superfamily phosphohydrolase (DUF442 family)
MSKHLALLLILLSPWGCQTVTDDQASTDPRAQPVRATDLGELHGVSVGSTAWIGGYPTSADLDLAHRRGIKAAIDLSTPEEAPGYDVQGTCERLRIEYVSINLESKSSIPDESVDRVLDELRRRAHEPLLLFCRDSSRAAMLFAIHRAIDDGLPLDQALVEARRAGMKPGHPEVFVRAQVKRLLSHS